MKKTIGKKKKEQSKEKSTLTKDKKLSLESRIMDKSWTHGGINE